MQEVYCGSSCEGPRRPEQEEVGRAFRPRCGPGSQGREREEPHTQMQRYPRKASASGSP